MTQDPKSLQHEANAIILNRLLNLSGPEKTIHEVLVEVSQCHQLEDALAAIVDYELQRSLPSIIKNLAFNKPYPTFFRLRIQQGIDAWTKALIEQRTKEGSDNVIQITEEPSDHGTDQTSGDHRTPRSDT